MLIVALCGEQLAAIAIALRFGCPIKAAPKIPILFGQDHLLSAFLPDTLFSASYLNACGIDVPLPFVLVVVETVIGRTVVMSVLPLGVIGLSV